MQLRDTRLAALTLALTTTTLVLGHGPFPPPQYITNVPDWSQPIQTGAPGGSTGDWRAWCVPASLATPLSHLSSSRPCSATSLTRFGSDSPRTPAWTPKLC